MLARLADSQPVEEVLLVGNTAMHHLFSGLSVEPLAAVPFRSPALRRPVFSTPASWAGLSIFAGGPASCLAWAGSWAATFWPAWSPSGWPRPPSPGRSLDLGTNGEIAVGNRGGIRVHSTAAGPAFEGGRIGMGHACRQRGDRRRVGS